MIFGVGADIIEIGRVESAVSGAAFYEKTFTAAEREYLLGRRPESAAGMFAAKEAVAKALGTGFRGFRPADVEIIHNELGAPYAALHGRAAEIAAENSVTKIHISISHCETYAAAYAIAEA